MLALLLVLTAVLVIVQGREAWIRITHPYKHQETIRRYADTYALDPLLVAAVVNVESKFNPQAVSPKGAKGLMQLMEDTARWGAEKIGLENYDPQQLYDPEINVRIGCWYLARLLHQYEGNLSVALAAYNGGSGNVARWLQDPAISADGKTLDAIPFPETQAYVSKVIKQYSHYQELYGPVSR